LNQNLNCVIEIDGPGKPKFKTVFKNQLKINTIESFGEIKVINNNDGKPLPKVYVKVFKMSKGSGTAKFFRDGYTDIRGKFEYAKASGDNLKDVEKFAILVSSQEFGSKILTQNPPKVEDEGDSYAGLSGMAAQKMNRL
jgi:hypothetical protein